MALVFHSVTRRKTFSIVILFVSLIISASAISIEIDDQKPSIRLAPGDDKLNYQNKDYQTDSLSLEHRTGSTLDLLAFSTTPQAGLPQLKQPANNQMSKAGIQLGRKLFFDRRLSLNKTMSCAMCHIPEQGFTNNELAVAIGSQGRGLKRNAPTILNTAYYSLLFADGRESSLEHQVWGPLLAANEMNNPSVGYVLDTIRGAKDYQGLFESAFGSSANIMNVGQALAQYERTLIAGDSKFDRWYFEGDQTAVNQSARRGFELFTGKAQCSTCHLVGNNEALFTDMKLHNTGMGYNNSMLSDATSVRIQLAPGVSALLSQAKLRSVGGAKQNDLGRYEITENPKDRWKFRTPILRNVALTAPYMHDGSLLSLAEVVQFYNDGGISHELLSPLISPLGLNDEEIDDVVEFLKSLTGSQLSLLVADAFAAPIGDIDD